jgi:hypothetical protein
MCCSNGAIANGNVSGKKKRGGQVKKLACLGPKSAGRAVWGPTPPGLLCTYGRPMALGCPVDYILYGLGLIPTAPSPLSPPFFVYIYIYTPTCL